MNDKGLHLMTQRRLIILCLCILTCGILQAQCSFLHYQIENGLPNNSVHCILQDNYGFMWFGTSDGLSRFDGKHFRTFDYNPANDNSLGNNFITTLFQDHKRNLWIGTNKGIFIYDSFTETFSSFKEATIDDVIISSRVNKIIGGNNDKIWIATQGQGIFMFDEKTKELVQNSSYTPFATALEKDPNGCIYTNTFQGGLVCLSSNGNFIRMYETNKQEGRQEIYMYAVKFLSNSLWFSVNSSGLDRLDFQTGKLFHYPLVNGYNISLKVKSIQVYELNKLMIGTDDGLYVFDISSTTFKKIRNYSANLDLSDQSINDTYCDREGGIWIATNFGGINYLPRNLTPFMHYYPGSKPDGMVGKAISQFCEDSRGNIWIGSEDGGLSYFDITSNIFKTYKPDNLGKGLSDFNIQALMIDGNKLWIGTNSKGIDILDLSSGRFTNFVHARGDTTSINDNKVNVIYKDTHGDIYVGTEWGLNKYNPQNGRFISISQASNQTHIYGIKEDQQGYLWIATRNVGIFRRSPNKNEWDNFNPSFRRNGRSIICNNVISIFEDSRHNVWFGTDGNGMYYFDHQKNHFIDFDSTNLILPNKVIYRIEEDINNNFWVSTNAGLICIDPYNRRIIHQFTSADGLQSNQFSFRSSLHASNGLMYFGGINGFNMFNPVEFVQNNYIPRVIITNIFIDNREVVPNDETGLLKNALAETKILHLNSYQNTVAIDFAALSYQSPQKNSYAYKLEGFDKEWNYTDSRGKAFYTNLSPGKYIFFVKGSNSDGLWNEKPTKLELVIHPPFYRTIFAYIIYLIVLFLIFYYTSNLWHKKLQRKHEKLLKISMEENEKEGLRSKVEFFTNIAHEIRTPLSLIKVPLDCIISSGDGNNTTKSYLHTISRNTDSLLDLTNQLLDFRKTEQKGFELKIVVFCITDLLKEVFDQFTTTAKIQNIEMQLFIPEESVMVHADPNAMKKIISNLLGNALKYARDKIELKLNILANGFEIVITDNGKGIEKEEMHRIFDPFYQTKNSKSGTGIGLSFAKLLTEKHSGRLFIEHSTSEGTSFVIRIPNLELSELEQTSHITNVVSNSGLVESDELSSHKKQSIKVLIVEDNEELLQILTDFLGQEFRIFSSLNGNEAVEVVQRENIDIIVSDIMMPEMDGYELCEFIKKEPLLCHIPVVMLSAKTTTEDKITGFDLGADLYIEKPFSPDLLLSSIKSMLENRKRLRNAFARTPYQVPASEITTSKKDQEFIDKLNNEIEKYISEEDFYIDTLAEEMCMSRSNFYRKIKGIFGMSPNDYLRTLRLKKSAELLIKGEFRITEIYQLVGFNSPSYFSKCFKEQFGVSPKEFVSNPHLQAQNSAN